MALDYRYLDMGDGLALCRMSSSGRTCYVFATDAMLPVRYNKTTPVDRRYLAARRAPNVLWKPNASRDVKSAIAVEMIDLKGPELDRLHMVAPLILSMCAASVGVLITVRA